MSKIRITTFNADNTVNRDRLIEAKAEFMTGPDQVHNGGFLRLDALLENNDDLYGLIEYLNKLIGKLPISPKDKAKQTKQLKSVQPLAADSVEKLIQEAFTKCKTQEALIDYLRGLNFVFLTYDHLKDICDKNEWPFKLKGKKGDWKGPRPLLHKDYQWMVRILKVAKVPANDKYDPQVFFGIKLIGDKRPKVIIYQLGKYSETKELHWAEGEEVQFKVKEKFYKFPEPMNYKERSNWRAEDRKVQHDPHKGTDLEYKPSNFYLKWKEFVTILKPQRAKKHK